MKKRNDFHTFRLLYAGLLSGITISDEFHSLSLFVLTWKLCSNVKSMLSKACFSYYLSRIILNFDWYQRNDKILSWWRVFWLWFMVSETAFICRINSIEQVAFVFKKSLKNCYKKLHICTQKIVLRLLHKIWPWSQNSIFFLFKQTMKNNNWWTK